jgi:hypothetical protein
MDGGLTHRPCAWGDSRYDGNPVYYYDTPGGNFRVWYVLTGPNALEDRGDENKNGFPDVVELIGADYEYTLAIAKKDKWYFHPNPEEGKYLPTRDYYPELNWPGEGEDYGGDDRWDVYCGALGGSALGMLFPFGPLPASERTCYAAYFNVTNAYQQETARPILAGMWGTATTYMFDAAEVSETSDWDWLVLATKYWMAEAAYPPEGKAPGEIHFASLLKDTLSPLTGHGAAFLYFLEDWSRRRWNPPRWRPLGDRPFVKCVWRATSRGDAWNTAEPELDRTTEAAFGYVVESHNRANDYVAGRGVQEAFEVFAAWNWFTGSRDDGRHYKYGSKYAELTPQNTWTDYPVVNYRPGSGAFMNYLAAGYYRFDSLPSWRAAVIKFAADAANRKESKDWGGLIMATKDGTAWTDLAGAPGEATPMFSPGDRGIIQVRDPAQYQSLLAVVDCVGYKGSGLGFKYSFVLTDDLRPPRLNLAAVRPQANPGAIEVLLGGDEKLFGAEGDVLFVEQGGPEGAREELAFAGAPGGNSFIATYALDPGVTGDGVITWRTADVAGNVVSGEKSFGAAYLASRGGTVASGRGALHVPAGALGGPTLFTIFPEEEGAPGARTAAAPAGDGSPEIVGPVCEIGPAWARPGAPFTVTLSYEGLALEREDYLSVYRRDGAGWQDLGGAVDRRGRRVAARTDRLGTFALGYGEKKGPAPRSAGPAAFALYQNYPNPARGETSIAYALPAAAEVELAVYDLSGRRVATLVRGAREAGVYEERYGLTEEGGRYLAAGVYVYRLRAGSRVAARKMVVSR